VLAQVISARSGAEKDGRGPNNQPHNLPNQVADL